LHKQGSRYKQTNTEYLQFRWRIRKNIILTIDFHKNGYMIIYFDDDKKISISKDLVKDLNLVNITIKKIKKIINARKLELSNIPSIFNETRKKINNTTLLDSNIIINGKLDIKQLNSSNKSQIDTLSLLDKIKMKLSRYHQFIVKKVQSSNSLTLFYKQVNNFYSVESILHYMSSIVKKKENVKMTKKDVDELINVCKKVFIIDERGNIKRKIIF